MHSCTDLKNFISANCTTHFHGIPRLGLRGG